MNANEFLRTKSV